MINWWMFYDWLYAYQDYDFDLPLISNSGSTRWELGEDGEFHTTSDLLQHTVKQEGSYSTTINVTVRGRRVIIDGNPSRFNRLDNLFGLTSLDACFAVYNTILASLGLPPFTKCTRVFYRQGEDGSKVSKLSDGAVIKRVDLTANKSVGKGNVDSYLKALSTCHYKYSVGHLQPNGKTVNWHNPKTGKSTTRLQYPKAYDKANELTLPGRALSKAKNLFSEESPEYQYVQRVHQYCSEQGVTRHELEVKSEMLQRLNCQYWGLFDESVLRDFHSEFFYLDERLQVDNMTLEGVAERLVSTGVVNSTLAANTTANYAFQWMHGRVFDSSNRSVQKHRARLRKLNIDIARPCDITTFSPVYVVSQRRIDVAPLEVPSWYIGPSTPLKIVS
jgi:hypothetical protein